MHLVISNLLPWAQRTIALATGKLCNEQAKALAPRQVEFKLQWIEMSKSDEQRRLERELQVCKGDLKGKAKVEPLQQIMNKGTRESGTYHTSIAKWTCSCPSFLLSQFLLCKHTVRLVNKELHDKPLTDLHFFAKLQRNRQPPYYEIPGIHTECTPGNSEGEEDEIIVLILGSPGAVLARKRKRAVSEVAALLERQHAEVREVIDEVEDSDVQAAMVMSEAGEGASYTQNNDPEHPCVSCSLFGKYLAMSENITKVSFSAARRQHLRECLDDILMLPQVSLFTPKWQIMEDVFVKVEKVGGDIRNIKRSEKTHVHGKIVPQTLYILTS
jgi:hypothetical protein